MNRRVLSCLAVMIAVALYSAPSLCLASDQGSGHAPAAAKPAPAAKPAAEHKPAADAGHAPAAPAHGSNEPAPAAAKPAEHAPAAPKPAAHAPAAIAKPPSPEAVMSMLKEGNGRFVAGESIAPNTHVGRRIDTATNGQKPVVTIVSCSDSRVPVELLFDRGIGDLFVIRVAGNVCDTDEIGSAEYGVDHLGTPVLLVLGHTKCGAVTAVATGAVVHGHIPDLVANIKPAVAAARQAHPDKTGEAIVPEAIKANVLQGIEDLITKSELIRKRLINNEVRIEGAVYDIAEGKIEWLGAHPRLGQILAAASQPAGADDHAAAAGNRHEQVAAAFPPAPPSHSAQESPPAPAHPAPAPPAPAAEQPVNPSQPTFNKPVRLSEPTGTPMPALLERCMGEEFYRQGVTHLNAGEHSQAAEKFRAASEIDPSMLAARNDLAGVYCLQQNYDEALKLYESVLAKDANHRLAIRGAALCHASLKRYDQAQAMLRKLVSLDRQDAQAWLELGDVSFLSGQADTARQLWTTASSTKGADKAIVNQANMRLKAYAAPTPAPTASAH